MNGYAQQCRPGRVHRWDYYSGWCIHNCGNRDDGRITNRHGDVLVEGDTPTPEELDEYRQRLEGKYNRGYSPANHDR